jgi:hypothetical protein
MNGNSKNDIQKRTKRIEVQRTGMQNICFLIFRYKQDRKILELKIKKCVFD